MIKDTKKEIIESLIEYNVKDIKELSKIIKEKKKNNVGYHSVYKNVKLLIEKNIIKKNEEGFQPNIEWVRDQVETLKTYEKYLEKKGNFQDKPNSTIVEFTDFKEMHKFIRNIETQHLDLFDSSKKGFAVWITNHCYNYLFQPAKELKHIKKIKEGNNDLTIICCNDSALDKWTKKAYDKRGAEMILDSSQRGLTELNIYDNFAIQIFYGKRFIKAVDEIYEDTKNVNDLDICHMMEKLEDLEYHIGVALYTNKSIINSLKERALKVIEMEKEKKKEEKS